MFQGSENHKDDYFKPFELAGATDQNGTTWYDRTNYFETVPTTALDMALWMESDRMGHLLGAIGQKELDKQRGVVQNEKRQGENQPYGRVDEHIQAEAFPANHPYHHDTIGSMKDLNAASLADVKQWFTRSLRRRQHRRSCWPATSRRRRAKAKVREIFRRHSRRPAGAAPAAVGGSAQRRRRAATMADHVAQMRIYREWNVPQLGDPDDTQLDLAAAVLGGGKTSRLYERLVYKDKIADGVSVDVEPFALASLFQLQVDVKKGVDPAKVEAAVADEWAQIPARTARPRTNSTRVQDAKRAPRSCAAWRRSTAGSILAEGQVYRDDPGAYKNDFARSSGHAGQRAAPREEVDRARATTR